MLTVLDFISDFKIQQILIFEIFLFEKTDGNTEHEFFGWRRIAHVAKRALGRYLRVDSKKFKP